MVFFRIWNLNLASEPVSCDGDRNMSGCWIFNRLEETMKLRKEATDEILEDSLEYKAAVKSVIRYEIQTLVSIHIAPGEKGH